MERSPDGLYIYRGNRLERLADALARSLSEPPPDALASECILVPGRGVAQWLTQELTRRFGVWANVLYLYPCNFVGWALERVLGLPAAELTSFDPERSFWAICGTLRALLQLPEFEALRRYVAGDESDVRYFELCRRIALTFDRYAAYRPELLRSWERKPKTGTDIPQLALFGASEPSQDWQPVLWRALVERSGSMPAATLERRFLRNLEQARRLAKLPSRISCFGLTHLPPSYTRILAALCPHVPVSMFQLSASRRAVEPGRGPRHPLLESLGTLASDFETVLQEELRRQEVRVQAHALYEEPGGSSRLLRLQRQILLDQVPDQPAQPATDSSGARDDSIEIHVCHSAMREVEVLHDQLMAVLSSDAGYEPRDVVVMMPDVEAYAPLIEAVFRRAADDPQRIPYCIADRVLEVSAPVANALDRLFRLVGQRLSTSQVLDLLTLDVVAARFEITPGDQEQIAEWLASTRVRWGVDAEHRQRHGHPPSDANTWRLGLRRLLLGYAVSSDPPALVAGVLPQDGASGSGAAALGKLAAFLEALFEHLEAFARPHPPAEWPEVVGAALDALILQDADSAWQHQELREALRSLAERAAAVGYEQPIGSTALRDLLFDAAGSARPARGFLMGGVTFCSMVPLRSLPFRMVCLLGLGDGEFPRRELHTDFDLISQGGEGRRPGDRSRRSEDRYIFLEAILAARQRLLITYTGQSIRDNSVLPPSVVVSELLDYLAEAEAPPRLDPASAGASQTARGAPDYIVRHPLQAFSSRYFDGGDARLFSYAAHYLGAARAARRHAASTEFFPAPLPAPAAADTLALTELIRFYQNPTAHLLHQRLEVFLRDQHRELGDREPQELSPLDKFSVGQQLLELHLRGLPEAASRQLIQATGALPLGAPGELDLLEIMASVTPIARWVSQARQAPSRPPLTVHARLPGGRELFGTLSQCYQRGLIEHQFARVRARHLIALWVRHLVYCWQGPSGEVQSSLFGRPQNGAGAVHHCFSAVKAPEMLLEALVRRYEDGQVRPLCLFPSTSLAYVQALRKPGKKADLFSLEKEWQRELEGDGHLQRVYGGYRSFSELRRAASYPAPFEELAVEIFEPLLQHLETREADANATEAEGELER